MNEPLWLRCENCHLIQKAPPNPVASGVECRSCGHNHFATHRDTPICDFCCSRALPVRMAYPARDFSVPMPVPTFHANSRGWWAACEPCHRLIQRGDREALAVRSAKVYAKQNTERIPRSLLTREIRKLHDQFWSNREGEPLEEPA